MASGPCSRELMKVLTTPSKIANALDWKKQIGGSIATIDVHADRIGLSISHHPSSSSGEDESTSSLSLSLSSSSSSLSSSLSSSFYSLPIRQKGKFKIPDSSRQQLSDLVQENKVCGFVVSWPIQKDTGLMGASCGRTLFAIEELLLQPSSSLSSAAAAASVFTSNRKICLWDGGVHVHDDQIKTDILGRSSVHARTSNQKEYRACKEKCRRDDTIVVTRVWEDFVKTNWPQIYQQQQPKSSMKSLSDSKNNQVNKDQQQEQQGQQHEQQEEEHNEDEDEDLHHQQRRILVAA